MASADVLVIGAGISGASFAFHAARAGRSVLVLERESRPGGCLHSERTPSGYWYELGAHTCYNSYGAFLEVLDGCGLLEALQPRGKPVLRFHDGRRSVPGKNLLVLLRLLGKLELAASIPGWFGASQEGQTVRSYYSRFVGKRNYERVLGPMLSAVPSQTADDFPADMLFKKRERRQDVMRSFTMQGGLQTAVEGVLRQERIEARLGCGVQRLERAGRGWKVTLDDGTSLEAGVVALAVPPGAAAALLEGVAPEAAAQAAGMKEAQVDTLGVVTGLDRSPLPYATFFIPLDDQFHSIVTRDVVPDTQRRAFTLHFRPGRSREERLQRTCEVLGVRPEDLEVTSERRTILPSPVLGHAQTVAGLDRLLATERLAVTGNWFSGLAIEDCALRSRAEWRRVEALG